MKRLSMVSKHIAFIIDDKTGEGTAYSTLHNLSVAIEFIEQGIGVPLDYGNSWSKVTPAEATKVGLTHSEKLHRLNFCVSDVDAWLDNKKSARRYDD